MGRGQRHEQAASAAALRRASEGAQPAWVTQIPERAAEIALHRRLDHLDSARLRGARTEEMIELIADAALADAVDRHRELLARPAHGGPISGPDAAREARRALDYWTREVFARGRAEGREQVIEQVRRCGNTMVCVLLRERALDGQTDPAAIVEDLAGADRVRELCAEYLLDGPAELAGTANLMSLYSEALLGRDVAAHLEACVRSKLELDDDM